MSSGGLRELAKPSDDPLIGATFGSFRVVRLLGRGGMGTVYLAEQPMIGKRVAIKVLHAKRGVDKDAVRRFFREAQLVNQIGSEHIIDVIDFGEREGEP